MDMNDKCKLVIITDTYVGIPGGSERHLYNFLSGVSAEIEVDVFQFIPSGNPMLTDGEFPSNPNNASIRLNSRPLNKISSLSYFKFLAELIHYIYTSKVDVVASYHEKAEITNFIIKFFFGKKVIAITSKRDQGFKLHGRLRRIIKYISPKFDAITSPSNSIKNWLKDDYEIAEDKIHVIKNGVDLSKYPGMNDSEIRVLKESLGFPQPTKLMTTVACLKPVKGHKDLLNAFSLFKKCLPSDWCLALIGDGELKAQLSEQVNDLGLAGCVHFLGYQTNVHEWLLATDVVISSSLSEGLSNSLIEGCAAHCPIIATNVGGNPEIVEAGYNGLLVEPSNPKQLSQAMISLAQDIDLRNRMSCHSRSKALSEFSNEAMVNSLESLYLQYKNKKDMVGANA